MKRSIEFRAWSKNEKRIFPVVFINFYEGYCMESERKAYGFDTKKWEFTADTILMEFTGLKDNKGRKLFEGDIIEITSNMPQKIKVKTKDIIEDLTTDVLGLEGEDFEIIGNIYENVELTV